mmetsp:Transcript_46480/g.100890  ORF Transcript_46480/g.100890 Transcript_46480/m.100890 type:complete len:203 (+) Transcript_46480:1118-1726(+)
MVAVFGGGVDGGRDSRRLYQPWGDAGWRGGGSVRDSVDKARLQIVTSGFRLWRGHVDRRGHQMRGHLRRGGRYHGHRVIVGWVGSKGGGPVVVRVWRNRAGHVGDGVGWRETERLWVRGDSSSRRYGRCSPVTTPHRWRLSAASRLAIREVVEQLHSPSESTPSAAYLWRAGLVLADDGRYRESLPTSSIANTRLGPRGSQQ